jgi:hypothetical protein
MWEKGYSWTTPAIVRQGKERPEQREREERGEESREQSDK